MSEDILLTEKLRVYGFDQPSPYFIYSNVIGRTQRTKVNNAYCSYTNIKYGVPQDSISNLFFLILIFAIYFCATINAK